MITPTEKLKQLLTLRRPTNGLVRAAMYLVQQGADPTLCGDRGTLLHILILGNKLGKRKNEIAELIRLNPAVLDCEDVDGRTPLQYLIDLHKRGLYASDGFEKTFNLLEQRADELQTLKPNEPIPNEPILQPKESATENATVSKDLTIDSPCIVKLLQDLKAMRDYGARVKAQGDWLKGYYADDLAHRLIIKTRNFLAQPPEARNFYAFRMDFSHDLHSRDEEMGKYRLAWNTVLANIAIALSGVGLILIGMRLLDTYTKTGRATFFFQKEKTTREQNVEAVDSSLLGVIACGSA